jgi:drug/metabolite transporter (DMT)-like permease
MSTPIMLAVLFGALLHASWNVLVKSGGDALIDTTTILLGGALLAAAAIPLLPLPARGSWPFIGISSLLQVGYFALVGAAYRSGEVSLAYPLMRGVAPLLVALASVVVLSEGLSAEAAAGVVIICAGVLTMTLSQRGRADWRTIGFALANAVVIASYTLVDGVGARRSGNALAYTLAIFLASCILFVPWMAWWHTAEIARAVRTRWHVGLGGGACIIFSYAVALWAMTRVPIAPVAALRETSILFGLVLARVVLHERPSTARVVAGLLILVGAGTLRLG